MEYVLASGLITENRARFWASQLAKAIEYLHTMNIAHRDIKTENILITEHFNVKLCDFGFSRYFGNEGELHTHTHMYLVVLIVEVKRKFQFLCLFYRGYYPAFDQTAFCQYQSTSDMHCFSLVTYVNSTLDHKMSSISRNSCQRKCTFLPFKL